MPLQQKRQKNTFASEYVQYTVLSDSETDVFDKE